jgi:ATP-dependent RNA helicase DDX10/DBP4
MIKKFNDLKKKRRKKKLLNFLKKYKISSIISAIIFKMGYQKLTRIQKISIPPSLKGYDVLCSAKTGSGKTLCFAIPIIQKINICKWSKNDPVYCCILCPVRELGIQLFGFFNNFSILTVVKIFLMIGGKIDKKKYFKNKFYSIIIATPGRLFQTINEKNNLNFEHLKILVLDEVDRILDLGFRNFFFEILKYFPKKKQILLFSATLTKKMRNIVRLNLRKPFFAGVINKKLKFDFQKKKNFPNIPTNILQYFNLLSPEKKTTVLFSFLKSHGHRKIIVFFSTKKQVKFFFFLFKYFNSNLNFFYSYGDLNQKKRTKNFIQFYKSKKGILFTTDIFSRGLDFKNVAWVIQFDCPQNIETYLHRIGRTGRISESGKTILFLNYNEIFFLEKLRINKIFISLINFNLKQIVSLNGKINKLTKKNKIINNMALDAFFNYIRYVFFQKNKKIFDLKNLQWHKIAEEYGLKKILIKRI